MTLCYLGLHTRKFWGYVNILNTEAAYIIDDKEIYIYTHPAHTYIYMFVYVSCLQHLKVIYIIEKLNLKDMYG